MYRGVKAMYDKFFNVLTIDSWNPNFNKTCQRLTDIGSLIGPRHSKHPLINQ